MRMNCVPGQPKLRAYLEPPLSKLVPFLCGKVVAQTTAMNELNHRHTVLASADIIALEVIKSI